jgi:hypothetical protein
MNRAAIEKVRELASLVFAVILSTTFKAHSAPEAVMLPVEELGKKFVLTGKLGIPLGNVVTVQGIVRKGPSIGYDDGPNLWVMRIEGVATQQRNRVPLAPYYGDWADAADLTDGIPKPETGIHYEVRGYETGGFFGIPSEVLKQANSSFPGPSHYFRNELKVFAVKRIQEVKFTPADFKGRRALFHGTAQTIDGSSLLKGDNWTLVVDPKAAWTSHVEGKTIEAFGFFDEGGNPKNFKLREGVWRLTRLEDQIGRRVELRGRAISSNGVWWFDYRGSNVQVPNMEKLPNWEIGNHFRPIIIRGILERAVDPSNQSSQYFVREASWEALADGLLVPEVVIRKDFERE